MMTVSFLLFGDLCISKKKGDTKKGEEEGLVAPFVGGGPRHRQRYNSVGGLFFLQEANQRGSKMKKKDEKRKKKNKKKKKSVGHPVDPSTG